MNDLSWGWIALMVGVPPLLGVIAAFPFWRRQEMILGNATGTLLVFGAAIASIVRESIALDRVTQACLQAGTVCWPEPSAFTRYAIYAVIGLIEVFVLFSVSLSVERRVRNRGYAPEWR